MRAAAIAVVLMLASCGPTYQMCTEIGCGYDDGAFFLFSARHDDWANEQNMEYTFEVSWDSTVVTCTGIVSEGVFCDDSSVEVQSFTDGSADFTGIEALVLKNTWPGTVHLSVWQFTGLVFDGDFEVVETVDYPNGEECDPECNYWVEDVDW